MSYFRSLVAGLSISLAAGIALAEPVSAPKRTLTGLYVTAEEAGALLADPKVLLVDIRSQAEVAFVGLPTRADKHIPFMVMAPGAPYDSEKETYPLVRNPHFARDFVFFMRDQGAGGETKVILMCRSGSRSAKAADILARMGYEQVYSMIDGFEGDRAPDGPQEGQRVLNGWKNAGLGWSYKVSVAQAYGEDF